MFGFFSISVMNVACVGSYWIVLNLQMAFGRMVLFCGVYYISLCLLGSLHLGTLFLLVGPIN